VCNPSRAASMSGLRPSTSGVYSNSIDWRPVVAPELTLVSHLRANGYEVQGGGKIYHGGFDRDSEWDAYFHPPADGKQVRRAAAGGVGGIKFGPIAGDDSALRDFKTASWAIEELGRRHDRPFFLAVGFHKPHMPWNVPQKYFDMYPLETIELPPYRDDDLNDLPPAGVKMAAPQGDHRAMLESGRWKEAVQAYLATITFLDGQVGRLIDAFDKSPHRDNTIIVLWGDHGWHLGEKHHWRKFALWEEATRAPFIWVVPGETPSGGRCQRTVDFMSIYPTICDLAGIDTPKHVEGTSIRSLLKNPSAEWTTPALTTHGYRNHAVRSEGYRFIRYADGGEELYDESRDPYEWQNLAGKPELAGVRAELARRLPSKDQQPAARAKAKGPARRAGRNAD
jgi:arylsulfatase A-like enzyme